MVALKHVSMREHKENSIPLLIEAGNPKNLGIKHIKGSRKFFLTQRQNLGLSLTLLLSCYTAILVPAYLPAQQITWTEISTKEYTVIQNYSAALLSRPCIHNSSKTKLQKLLNFQSLPQIPVFLLNETGQWKLSPPLGLLGSESTLAQAFRFLPHSGLPFVSDKCRRCIVVGSGGILHGKDLGTHIDKYDVIIRLNNAPVFGFEEDAGSRTTIRLIYPEAATFLAQEYHNTDIVALVVFKRLDIEWLTSILTKKPLNWWSQQGFWREVVKDIPLQPESFRILNPETVSWAWNVLQTYEKQGSQTVPTIGLIGVVMALQLCDEVHMVGFGYDLKHPGLPLHYYGTVRMDHMTAQINHDISAEHRFLRDLVKSGVVQDITGGV